MKKRKLKKENKNLIRYKKEANQVMREAKFEIESDRHRIESDRHRIDKLKMLIFQQFILLETLKEKFGFSDDDIDFNMQNISDIGK